MENVKGKLRYCSIKDGVMSEWAIGDGLDRQLESGYYLVEIHHTGENDGLPVSFCGNEHYLLAHLLVTESGTGDRLQRDRVIGQTLVFTDRQSAATGVFSRSGEFVADGVVWGEWTQASAGKDSGKEVLWDANSNIDAYTGQGTYAITGERLNSGDGLPIANSNPGHTISARLVVLDSSITGTGESDDKCITQVLAMSNRTGGDGDIYVRTGRAASKNQLMSGSGWEPWGRLQQNVQVGQVASLDSFIGNGIYSGVYTYGSSVETFVMVVINNYAVSAANGEVRSISQFKYALGLDGTFSYKTRVGQGSSGVSWGNWVDMGATRTTDIQDNSITAQKLSVNVREKIEKIEPLEKVIEAEKTALKNGDTIVGLAREVYSRQGKVDTATFQKRTTAGATSISDGVAKIKQIGGNIVKNLVDGTFAEGWAGITSVDGDVVYVVPDTAYFALRYKYVPVLGHKYYISCFVNKVYGDGVTVFLRYGSGQSATTSDFGWRHLSRVCENSGPSDLYRFEVMSSLADVKFYVTRPLMIDLTEMFGAGYEPTVDECDKMFATMGALAKGLAFVHPGSFRSVGYNQWNPDNIIKNTGIVSDALEPDMPTSVAVVGCIPCKTGAGENNGYVIGYGEGDSWSDEGVEVYLSLFNPLEMDGELYLCKLEKDATYSTYVPTLNGYLLVVTPETSKFCAHLRWSGDRAQTDYEEYSESNIALPVVPEISEWGMAGTSRNGIILSDVIDLDSKKFVKRVFSVDLAEQGFNIQNSSWLAYSNGEQALFVPVSIAASSRGGYAYSVAEMNTKYRVTCTYDEASDKLTVSETSGSFLQGLVLARDSDKDVHRARLYFGFKKAENGSEFSSYYIRTDSNKAYYGVANNQAVFNVNSSGDIVVNDAAIYGMSDAEVRTYLRSNKVKIYYAAITPEVYDITGELDNNYIGCDYGVEGFTGSEVPLNSNILFYMRSLVNETRNFLDRLMSGFGTTDVSAIADRIVAVLNPSVMNDDVIEEADIV